MNQPGDEFDGQGTTLHDACDDAWKKAKRAGKNAGWYEIKKMEVRTENPIREYRVKIKG